MFFKQHCCGKYSTRLILAHAVNDPLPGAGAWPHCYIGQWSHITFMPFSGAVRIVAAKGDEVGRAMSSDQPEDTYVIFFFFNLFPQGANFLFFCIKQRHHLCMGLIFYFFLGPSLHLCDLGLTSHTP